MTKKINFIPERLRELRKRDGSTQKEFGEKVGCTMASISAYENGSKVPPTPTLIKIAETCDCSIDWLFGLRDDSIAGNEEPAAKTYSDYIKRLFALDDGSVSLWVNDSTETDPYTGTICYTLAFTDSILNTFLTAWKKTRSLYLDGTIDSTIYQAWKEKILRDFNAPILTDDLAWQSFTSLYKDLRHNDFCSQYDAVIEALQFPQPTEI